MSAQNKKGRPGGVVKQASTFGARRGPQDGFLGVCDSVYGFDGPDGGVDDGQEGCAGDYADDAHAGGEQVAGGQGGDAQEVAGSGVADAGD